MRLATSPSIGSTLSFFDPRAKPQAQPPIHSILKNKTEKVDRVVGRCIMWINIPFSTTKNNPFHHAMQDNVSFVGLGYKDPIYDELKRAVIQNKIRLDWMS